MAEVSCKCPACVPDTDCICQEIEVKVCPRHGSLAIPAAVHNFEARIVHLEAELRRERYLAHLAAEINLQEKEEDKPPSSSGSSSASGETRDA